MEEILITKFPCYYVLLSNVKMMVVVRFMPNGMEGVIEKWRRRKKRDL
jgi:hypothetical protein